MPIASFYAGNPVKMANINNIPCLIKHHRERLGLTQEQFAHKVGVTFSTVKQWENGRRRPRTFLLKRLLEMEAALGEGSAGRLTKEEAKTFKRKWAVVNAPADQPSDQSGGQSFLSRPAMVCARSPGFPPDAPLSGGVGLGS